MRAGRLVQIKEDRMAMGAHRGLLVARVCVCLGVLVGILAVPFAAQAAPAAQAYSNGHPYCHGVVPTRGASGTASGRPAAAGTNSADELSYGGGVSGVGVTAGTPKVYLVLWGSQWGSQGTNSVGNA